MFDKSGDAEAKLTMLFGSLKSPLFAPRRRKWWLDLFLGQTADLTLLKREETTKHSTTAVWFSSRSTQATKRPVMRRIQYNHDTLDKMPTSILISYLSCSIRSGKVSLNVRGFSATEPHDHIPPPLRDHCTYIPVESGTSKPSKLFASPL